MSHPSQEQVPILMVDFRSGKETLLFVTRRSLHVKTHLYPVFGGHVMKVSLPTPCADGYFLKHVGGRDAELVPLHGDKLQRVLEHKLRKEYLLRCLATYGRRKRKPFAYRASPLSRFQ